MKCAEIREVLPAYVEDRDSDLTVRRHLSRCTECRAELETYRSIRTGMSAMRSVAAEPPVDLLTRLTAIPAESPATVRVRTHVARHRSAYASGIAIAVVGAAGAALWRSRRSRLVAA